MSCGWNLIAVTEFSPSSHFGGGTLRWGTLVTSVFEWVDSCRLFLTAKDQDSGNACSLVPHIGAVSEPCLFST